MLDMYDLAVIQQFMINVVFPEKNYLEMYICSQLHIPDLNHNWLLGKKNTNCYSVFISVTDLMAASLSTITVLVF